MVREEQLPIVVSKTLDQATSRNPHLKRYMDQLVQEGKAPTFHERLERNMSGLSNPNIIYPVGDPIFIHLHKSDEGLVVYDSVQPELTAEEEKIFEQLNSRLIEIAHTLPVPRERSAIAQILTKLFEQIVEQSNNPTPIQKEGEKKGGVASLMGGGGARGKIKVNQESYDKLKYYLLRDRVGYSSLEPLLRDPYIEDIHCTGVGNVHLIHKIFNMVKTNIVFSDDLMPPG
jgi:flagellar protein FlaI